MKYRDAFQWGTKILSENNIPEAALDSRLLLEFVCSTNRNDLYAHGDMEIEPEKEEAYRNCISRRSERIPLQHITGSQEFMGIEFKVTGDVLVPRQDTEILVEEALRYLMDGESVLDMCTGSGCILLSVMKYKNAIKGFGVDVSEKALEVARYNYEKLQPELNGEAQFLESDLFEKVEGDYDMILSNPPYIKTKVIDTLETEVRNHDPMLALDGGEDGLEFYRRIVSAAPLHLRDEGMLLVEIGHDQREDVEKLFWDNGFNDIYTVKDLAGLDRVVVGRK